MNAHAAFPSVCHWHHLGTSHLTVLMWCYVFTCVCVHVIYCTFYILLLCCHGIVFSRTSTNFYDMRWHDAMINLDGRTLLVSQSRKMSLNPFISIQLCLSKMKLNAIFYQSILMPDHTLSFAHLMAMIGRSSAPQVSHGLSKNRTSSSFLCIAFFLGLLLNIRPLDKLPQTR